MTHKELEEMLESKEGRIAFQVGVISKLHVEIAQLKESRDNLLRQIAALQRLNLEQEETITKLVAEKSA